MVVRGNCDEPTLPVYCAPTLLPSQLRWLARYIQTPSWTLEPFISSLICPADSGFRNRPSRKRGRVTCHQSLLRSSALVSVIKGARLFFLVHYAQAWHHHVPARRLQASGVISIAQVIVKQPGRSTVLELPNPVNRVSVGLSHSPLRSSTSCFRPLAVHSTHRHPVIGFAVFPEYRYRRCRPIGSLVLNFAIRLDTRLCSVSLGSDGSRN